MKIRQKKTGLEGSSTKFNTHGLSEIIVMFRSPDDMDSDFIGNYDVYLESSKQWKDLAQSFKDKDVIIDNYNTKFFEPPTEEDKARGFTL